ncbi:hypothetical protein [Microcoleus sp. bin38.metabat.b11b12b14.051]|uniref:hypothetical protein n=1 Tax=Microcoleus sp. bin38.metabat.b11b12b14.051 TaxID=2742709 RepID=UPI0025EAC6C9|nr:hypothetical protein [Microcoleus sp. bin38.metabat.b11b12b14.051]
MIFLAFPDRRSRNCHHSAAASGKYNLSCGRVWAPQQQLGGRQKMAVRSIEQTQYITPAL